MNKLLLATFIVWLIIVSVIIHKLQRVVPEVLPVIEQMDEPEQSVNELDSLINATAASYGLDKQLFHCVLQVESNKRLGAVNELTGDYGIGQINSKSWRKFDTNRLTTDLQYSLNASAEVLSFYRQLKQQDEPRQWACRYNVGPGDLTQGKRGYNCEVYLEKLTSCLNPK
jgi:soluble lytic murein transglycosylase-like protein